MYSRAVVAAVLLSILVFGCLGPSVPSGGSDQGGQQQGGGQQTGPQAGGNESNGSQPSGGNSNGGGTTPGGNNLANLAYGELIALGVPIQCDITTTSGGNPVTAKLYKGAGPDMRVESPAAGGPCATMVSLMIGDKYYVGCDQGEVMPGCQWLVFTQNKSAGAATYEKPDYSSLPASQIRCIPWVFDASKLAAPANACNLDDLMKPPNY
ncbi:MAG: hypothetical protein PHV13_00780 [Candidatus ainarchaeum sp.]|nr:hypothetical protein [Candidatus ainarchaeum sp.]